MQNSTTAIQTNNLVQTSHMPSDQKKLGLFYGSQELQCYLYY